MNNIKQYLDELDRMIANGSPLDAVRSQVRLIIREVADLQTENARLAQDYAQLEKAFLLLQAQSR
jgi:hypothetical protein